MRVFHLSVPRIFSERNFMALMLKLGFNGIESIWNLSKSVPFLVTETNRLCTINLINKLKFGVIGYFKVDKKFHGNSQISLANQLIYLCMQVNENDRKKHKLGNSQCKSLLVASNFANKVWNSNRSNKIFFGRFSFAQWCIHIACHLVHRINEYAHTHEECERNWPYTNLKQNQFWCENQKKTAQHCVFLLFKHFFNGYSFGFIL